MKVNNKKLIFLDFLLIAGAIILLTYKWFSLGFSEYEMTAMISRVWDIKSQILTHHHFPSWTQFYMSGSSYTLWYGQGLFIFFTMFLSFFFSLEVAAKLVVLIPLLGSALTMYFLIWILFKNRASALIGAIVYSLHPIQMLHAAKWEHLHFPLYYSFIPLTFVFFVKAVQNKSVKYIAFTSFTLMLMLASANEQTMVMAGFLLLYVLFVTLWDYKKENLISNTKTYLAIILGALALGAFFIVPGIAEKGYCKLFLGDPLAGWRQTYSLKNIFFLFNRDGLILNPVLKYLHPILRLESKEKYFGIVPFILIITVFLSKKRREHRVLFWFAVSSFVLAVMSATGVFSIYKINHITLTSLIKNAPFMESLPVFLILFAVILALLTFLYKVRTNPKKIALFLGLLAVILFFKPFWLIQRLPFFKHMRCPYYFLDIAGVFFFAILSSFFVFEVLSKIKRKWLYYIATYVLFALIIFDYFPYTKHFRRNNVLPSVREDLKTTYQTIGKDPENIKVYYLSSHYYNMLGPMFSGKPLVYEACFSWMCPKGMGVLITHSRNLNLQRAFFNLNSVKYIVIEKADKNTYESIKKNKLLDAYQKIYLAFLENESFLVLKNPHCRPYVQGYNSKALYIGDYVASGKMALLLSAKNVSLVQGEFKSLKEYPLEYLDSFDYIFYNKAYDEDTDYLLRVEEEFKDKFYDLTTNPYLEIENAEQVEFKDVIVTRISSDEVKVQLTSPEDTILMLSESYYPRWQVWVNGEKEKFLQVNCGFMGVEAKQGENEITFKYVNPWYYKIAYLISISAFVVMIVLLRKPSGAQKAKRMIVGKKEKMAPQ